MAFSGETVLPLVLEAPGIYKHFGPAHTLNGVERCVFRGEVVALFGNNGAGNDDCIDPTALVEHEAARTEKVAAASA